MPRLGRWIMLGLLLVASCEADQEAPVIEGRQPNPILRGIAGLSHPSAAVRERGAAEIKRLLGEGPTLAQVQLILHAASRPWPSPDGPVTLVRLLAEARPTEAAVAEVEAAFPSLVEGARGEALSLLLGISGPVATAAFAQLYPSLGPETQVDLQRLRDEPEHAKLLFPALFSRLDSYDWFDIVHTTLMYLQAGQLDADDLAVIRPRLMKDWRVLHRHLALEQKQRGLAWVWGAEYRVHRNQAALLLDLFGYFDREDVERPLRQASKLRDPRVLLFAGTSAVRVGLPLPKKVYASAAAWPETRGSLFQMLDHLDALDRMPERFTTQVALAESDMVRWLANGGELGEGPAQIELMLTDQPDDGGTWYLYRFRVEAPHPMADNGWMAGAAGPFFRDAPGESGPGTFSHFASWAEATPEEHLGKIRDRGQEEEAEPEDDE